MRLKTNLLIAGLMMAVTATALQAETKLSDLMSSDAEVKKVVGDCKFTEGPVWHPDGFLLFSDIPNERIVRVNSDGSASDFLTSSGRANGLICDKAGNIFACQGGLHRIARLTKDGKVASVLAEQYKNIDLNQPNDLALDSSGGLYFTDPFYAKGDPPQPTMGVYYVSSTGQLKQVISDYVRPNGVTVSPDGKYLYVAEIGQNQIFRYDILGPGKITAGKLIFSADKEEFGGGPDGMAHDAHGNLYATYKDVVVLDPNGRLIGRIPVPENPANCTFGGADGKTLYITARTSLYSVQMKVAGPKLFASGPAGEKLSRVSKTETVGFANIADDKKVETESVKLGGITLAIPKSWKKGNPTSRLRLAQYAVPATKDDKEDAELVIFPPFGGSVDANIQRFLGQFKPDGLKQKLTKGECEQGTYYLVDLSGTYKKSIGPPFARMTEDKADYRMLEIILSVPKEGNYFIKLTGPKNTIDANAANFRNLFGGDAKKEKEYKLGG